MVSGGVQRNVVPNELRATFDVRISPLMNLQEFSDKINHWVKDAGEGVAIEFYQKHLDQVTSIYSSKRVFENQLIVMTDAVSTDRVGKWPWNHDASKSLSFISSDNDRRINEIQVVDGVF